MHGADAGGRARRDHADRSGRAYPARNFAMIIAVVAASRGGAAAGARQRCAPWPTSPRSRPACRARSCRSGRWSRNCSPSARRRSR
ncbi:MAG: hypothetical protein MZU95_10635 [Desulfomicrobium escambiense]|nr:hypothetical protein [Desulfomicrobium escambiense]